MDEIMEPRRGAASSCALAAKERTGGRGGGRVGAAAMSVVVVNDKASHHIQITALSQTAKTALSRVQDTGVGGCEVAGGLVRRKGVQVMLVGGSDSLQHEDLVTVNSWGRCCTTEVFSLRREIEADGCNCCRRRPPVVPVPVGCSPRPRKLHEDIEDKGGGEILEMMQRDFSQ